MNPELERLLGALAARDHASLAEFDQAAAEVERLLQPILNRLSPDSRAEFSSRPLYHLLSMGRLSGDQECFYPFALAADDHAWEAFEPVACRDFGIGVAPVTKQAHLIEADFALPDAEREMLDQRARQLLAEKLRHDDYGSP